MTGPRGAAGGPPAPADGGGAAAVSSRIAGLDVARGLAVLGMFAAHMRLGDELALDPGSWWALADGRSSILFATLAGVSIALLSGRTRPPQGAGMNRARLRVLVRAGWVLLIGLVLEALDTFVAVILGVYAVLFVLALPVMAWPVRRLLALAVALAAVGPPLLVPLGQVATEAGVEENPLVFLTVTGYYPALLWLAFVLVGLAVGRQDLTSGAVRLRLAVAGAVAAVAGYAGGWLSTEMVGGGVVRGPEAGFPADPGEWDPAWMTGAEPHSGTTFELVGSTGVALVVLAGCLVLAERLPALTAPLGAVGALALTVYTTHVVAIAVLLVVDPSAAEGLGTWLVFAVAAVLGATTWQVAFGRGPLERLLTWTSSKVAGVRPSSPAV